ncbi:MAG: SURF1 family protein [Burkholderiales bacterium]|nr:SURF1 family protein [Burkholderiales bacterium]
MRNSFRSRLWPLIVTVILVCLGLSLAQWQTRRAREKELIASQMAERTQMPTVLLSAFQSKENLLTFRKIAVQGQFVPEWTLYLDNRPLNGQAGMYVLMPIRIVGDDRRLLVARGWHARDPLDRKHLPKLATPEGNIRIEGVVRDHLDRVMQLGADEPLVGGSIIQNLDLDALARRSGMRFYPFIIEQTSELPDGLDRHWPQPSSGSEKHRAYAFQWYALTLMVIIFFVVTGFRRGKNK